MISVRVFDLAAGPRTAKVVQVRQDGTISSELQKFSAAVGGSVALPDVLFHTVRAKKIHNIPLPTDRPFAELDITHGSYIILRKKANNNNNHSSTSGATKEKTENEKEATPAHTLLKENTPKASVMLSPTNKPGVGKSNPVGVMDEERKLTTTTTPDGITYTEPSTVSELKSKCDDGIMHSLVKEVDKLRQETVSLLKNNKNDFMSDQIKFERERLLEMQDVMTRQLEQQSAIEKSITAMQQQTNEHKSEVVTLKSIQDFNEKLSDELTVVRQKMHANVHASVMTIMNLQEKIEESVRILVFKGENKGNLSTNTNTELNTNSNIGVPLHGVAIEKELVIHEILLNQFFPLVGLTAFTVSDLLYRFRSNLSELYTAISMKYNLSQSLMHDSVYGYLHTHLPHLAPATTVICFLHDGHEVEYLEQITLNILGLTLLRSPSTWLEVRLPGSYKRSFYYFSSLVGLSQREKPKWLEALDVEIGVCRISDFCSICPRLSLRNPEWTNNDAPYSKLLRSKAASLVLSRRPNLQGSIDVILNSYAGREETLLKHLCVSQQRINSAEVHQILQRHQDSIRAQSTLWLSKAQVRDYYGIKCRGGVTIDAEVFGSRSIFCISEYSSSERKRLLSIQSPPINRDNKWLKLTKTSSSYKSLTWNPATLEEYFYASLFDNGEGISNETLLVDAKVALPSSSSRTLSLFNAQETSNPFLIDGALQHTHLITGKPFSHPVSSALSTLWSQFGYISLRWIQHDEISNLQGISVSPGEESHRVYDLEPVDLVHFTQTDDENQKKILHSIPRWALLQSLKKPIILSGTRYLSWRQMNLDMDIKGNRCTTTSRNPQLKGLSTSQHDIWIHCDHNLLYTGAPQRRHIVHILLFYNSSQLVA